MFSAISYKNDGLHLLDQRKLPLTEQWLHCPDLESAALAIEDMVVRGAPAIGCTAAFALAQFSNESRFDGLSHQAFKPFFNEAVSRLEKTRPTAVNLFYALNGSGKVLASLASEATMDECRRVLDAFAQDLFSEDQKTCLAIGEHGAGLAPAGHKLKVLTHCNTGALATAGYGTALGIIRSLHRKNALECVYADETRPWLQGARLTAFELEKEGIPYFVQSDGAAAHLMKTQKIDWIVVGADRIAANGDTANKIGTYSLAVLARYHGVKFIVAAPWTTFDPTIKTGDEIPIEQRPASEVTSLQGVQVAPESARAFNPSFDVTPAELISAIVTEDGVLEGDYAAAIARHFGC